VGFAQLRQSLPRVTSPHQRTVLHPVHRECGNTHVKIWGQSFQSRASRASQYPPVYVHTDSSPSPSVGANHRACGTALFSSCALRVACANTNQSESVNTSAISTLFQLRVLSSALWTADCQRQAEPDGR
jgi:hypothetical protein